MCPLGPPSKRQKSEDAHVSNDAVDPGDLTSNSQAPIVPTKIPHTGIWNVSQGGNILYRTPQHFNPPLRPQHLSEFSDSSTSTSIAVAGFDLSGTILTSEKQFPHALSDYSLYNHDVISKIRQCLSRSPLQAQTKTYGGGHVLIIFINQGGIRGAVNGKTAGKVKDLIEWLSTMIRNDSSPSELDSVYAFVSTQKKSGYHKPSQKMWIAAQEILQCTFDPTSSFFVGDGVDYVDETTGEKVPGDDESFAKNAGLLDSASASGSSRSGFFTSQSFFGVSHLESKAEQRMKIQQDGRLEYDVPPQSALEARAALLCGTSDASKGMLLLLCGGQGSGKSYFCHELLKECSGDNGNAAKWVHLSQDTISNGKPGSREAVERAAKQALSNCLCVAVDRMHLDPTQRSHFIKIAADVGVPAHVLALTTPRAVVKARVLHRQNHVGKVGGQSGAKLASKSWSNLVMPKYEEGFDLISASGTEAGIRSFVQLYRRILKSGSSVVGSDFAAEDRIEISCLSPVPPITLGTYKLEKKITTSIVSLAAELGINAVDTAPTYKNEVEVGNGMQNADKGDTFCIAKIPKRATTAAQVRQELQSTLKSLSRSRVDLLLLHWPCDVIAANALKDVWMAMEDCVKDGMADALGVCNFNIEALCLLLPHCRAMRPVVNQVERHVLLPQWELVEFCAQHDICLQAHSPLGQGELLDHNVAKEVAARSGLTPAQVLVGWNLRQQIPVVTKCSSKEHLLDVLGASKRSSGAKIEGDDRMLSTKDFMTLNGIACQASKRFVAPRFMFGKEPFCWGTRLPK